MTNEKFKTLSDDMTRLSYWFPKLEAAGLPVPRTIIIPAIFGEVDGLRQLVDGETEKPDFRVEKLVRQIKSAANEIGYPCFLRTDHTSAKHDWERTCFLTDSKNILSHILSIVEYWELVHIVAPPCDMWVVREFLLTMPVGICRGYENMPICREFRFFVADGEVKCWHPYWPLKALKQGGAEYFGSFDYDFFCKPDNIEELTKLASAAGAAVGGAWSVDLLETKRGWFITDMAEAYKSFHWEGCPNIELLR